MRARIPILCVTGALAVAACSGSGSSGAGSNDGGAGASSGGAGGGATGGSGGSATGGSGGSATGGSGGSGTGGSGTGGGGTGGTSGSAGQGSGGTGTGGSGGGTGGGGGSGGTGGSGATGNLPGIGGCAVFTGDDDWNKDISGATADATWTSRVQGMVGGINIHPDYGGTDYGIPINVVPQTQPDVSVVFDWWPGESDPGPWPLPGPGTVQLEGTSDATSCSGDCHLIVIQQGTCMLYEGYACQYASDGWHCGNGAKWDLTKKSFGQRPVGWTSADAAGLAIMPGLLRYAEVQAGAIDHAIRFTLDCTTNKYVDPATHQAVPNGCDPANKAPMGLRVRLKANYDASGATAGAQVVLAAMKKYGMILADNGSNFYFQGERNASWPDADIESLKDVPASAFEVVTPGPLKP